MTELAELHGLARLRHQTQGDPRVSLAVLDGPVDLAHPCFAGAELQPIVTLADGQVGGGSSTGHGTHVASVIFGQPGSPVSGVAPRCRGLIVPIFSDMEGSLSQLDLARAINQAVEAGAQIINVSGGQLGQPQEAEPLLAQAIDNCRTRKVLIVAATGNDGCACLHLPAALPLVLAVGGMDENGRPLVASNWGSVYQTQGILAPGRNILGAKPGGGTVRASGTSFAVPIVAGVAALLLALQLARGRAPDPIAVREALLRSALPCTDNAEEMRERCLSGRLNVLGAIENLKLENHTMSESKIDTIETTGTALPEPPGVSENQGIAPSGCTCQSSGSGGDVGRPADPGTGESAPEVAASSVQPSTGAPGPVATDVTAAVRPQVSLPMLTETPAPIGRDLVYALGELGYDFGTEARRDSFKQLMPAADVGGGVLVPANPYDARQMVDYLRDNPSEARSLIWTLNLDLTPIYAIEAEGPFARDVYGHLHRLLEGQVQAETAEDYVERVSIPARLSGRSVRLFSGQILPVLSLENTRGLYGWAVNTLQEAALSAVKQEQPDIQEHVARKALTSFLYQVYYKLRNLGQSSSDRALNFAATNAFQVATVFSEAVGLGMELDTIQVVRSPFCRMDSDCWDVTLAFFDAENIMRARKQFQFTIDVSDVIPVSLGEVRSWSSR
jgi:cyanobactin maturation PatA/PatG family protease